MQKENLQRKDHRAKKNKANRRKEAILTITKRKNKKEKRERKDYETKDMVKKVIKWIIIGVVIFFVASIVINGMFF